MPADGAYGAPSGSRLVCRRTAASRLTDPPAWICQNAPDKEVGMMAVPFRRTSKTRKRLRRTHFKLQVPGMVQCPNCGEWKLAHRVCKACGTYKGRDVVNK
ncbi:LSU ribosomal protein L32P [Geobacillus sp. WSUCF1]|nr:LSU ribosomal protein L32P [Geobacillus sp. WSUCF1]